MLFKLSQHSGPTSVFGKLDVLKQRQRGLAKEKPGKMSKAVLFVVGLQQVDRVGGNAEAGHGPASG